MRTVEPIHWEKIRQRLLKRQQQLQISNYAIAKIAGVSKTTVMRIMDGTTVPSVEVYLRILEALQIKSILRDI